MWKLSDKSDLNYLKQRFIWVADMQGVQQDPEYHAEGDVFIHTGMVVEALQLLPEFSTLEAQDRQLLIAAALLHDVEKRSTTVVESDGRVTSKGHAKKGEVTSRRILYEEEPAPFFIREVICKLVRHHGLPLWIFEKEDPKKALIMASLEVNTFLLYLLCKADILGRISKDRQELLYRLELFRELCEEHECWGKPKSFVNDFARYFYLSKPDVDPSFVPYDDSKFEVVMMSGLPGAGKDSFILDRLDNDWPVVSLDDIRRKINIDPADKSGNGRVIQEAKEQARVYMRQKQSFIWNATNTTRSMREQVVELFTSYGGKVKIVYVEVPYKMLFAQNNAREHTVPRAVLQRLIHKLDVPTVNEAHVVEYFVR